MLKNRDEKRRPIKDRVYEGTTFTEHSYYSTHISFLCEVTTCYSYLLQYGFAIWLHETCKQTDAEVEN